MKMKTNETIASALVLALAASLATAGAARAERLSVPLTDTGKPARVEASLVMGSIHVVAGKPGAVVIDASANERDEDEDCDDCDAGIQPVLAGSAKDKEEKGKSDKSKLKRIPNNSFRLSAEEDHNRVKIGAESWARAVDLEIEVPPGSTLQLSTVNDGDIEVEGVEGELELHNTNGAITVRDAKGPVNANTVNGDVKVVFSKTIAAEPMAFSTLNGDVDLTLPASAKLDVRLQSDNGDIYSDFDVALSQRPAKVEEDRAHGRYRVSVAKELTGKIGGGGPELFLKTFNGDIVLRKAD
jgi:hypothetical protein